MPGLLAFHAHPDDETTSTGGVLARYAAAGEQVVVVTATDGAEGEIHNYQNPEEVKPRLAEVRAEELAAALALLGVRHHASLGYRDSGMMGTTSNDHPDSFWRADFGEATRRLVALLRRYRPEVVVIYDPFGGYGHPDHIQVHRVGVAAFFSGNDLGRFPLEDGESSWTPSKLYWSAFPRSQVRRIAQAGRETGYFTEEQAERMSGAGIPDEEITTWVDISQLLDRKHEAWRAHRTQIPDDWFLLRAGSDREVFGKEGFVRIFSRVEAPLPEDDLFAGLR